MNMVYQEEPLGGLCVVEGARVPAPFELRRGSKTSLGFAGRKPWATGPTTGGGGALPHFERQAWGPSPSRVEGLGGGWARRSLLGRIVVRHR